MHPCTRARLPASNGHRQILIGSVRVLSLEYKIRECLVFSRKKTSALPLFVPQMDTEWKYEPTDRPSGHTQTTATPKTSPYTFVSFSEKIRGHLLYRRNFVDPVAKLGLVRFAPGQGWEVG